MNDDKTFFVDAAAFPGNSGSPVFLNPTSMTYDKTGLSPFPGGFIGVIGSISLIRRPQLVFKQNVSV
jgi:hypothetical protein